MIYVLLYLVIGSLLAAYVSYYFAKFGRDYSDAIMIQSFKWKKDDRIITEEYANDYHKIMGKVIWFVPVFWLPFILLTITGVIKSRFKS